MLKTGFRIGIVGLFLSLIVSFYQILLPNQLYLNNVSNDVSAKMRDRSKAEIVSELKAIKKRIERFEKINGLSGTNGFKVYSAEETGKLIKYYQDLRAGLEYLNRGSIIAIKDWEGYVLEDRGRTAYNSNEAVQILNELDQIDLPSVFLTDFRIYLLPSGTPEISGLGGAGYAMISAPLIREKSIEQLRVTLLHELGHHIHSSFMPSFSGRPNPLWEDYHEIRGGEWQGPGAVNTLAWSSSSEETFAEDFRMLFGKDQWYYGDIDLGDPREEPEVAVELKQFMIGLKGQEISQLSKSPWVPEGLEFWLNCSNYIRIGWVLITIGMFIVLTNHKTKKAGVLNNIFHRIRSSGLPGSGLN
ncbi:MAG: hypothetical protein ACM3YE_13100 [Bacteroidota bacterium]